MAFNDKEMQVIEWGKQNGKSVQEMQDAIFRLRTTGSPKDLSQVVETKQDGLFSGIKKDFSNRVLNAQIAQEEAISGQRSDISAAGRTLGEGARFLGDLGSRALSTITPDPLGEVVLEGVGNVVQSKPAQEVIKQYQDLKTKYPEAVQGLEDIGAIASTLFAPGSANLATKTALSAVENSAKVLSGITKTGVQGIKEASKNALKPEDLMQRVARISKGKQQKFENLAGESVGSYLVKRGIFGDIDEITDKLYKNFETSKGIVDKEFAKMGGTYKPTAVGVALKELLKREESISSPGAVSRDLERVRELVRKNNGSGLSMSEINEAKRLYERNVRLDYMKENLPEKVARANTIDSSIRNWQLQKANEMGFTNVRELNKETQLAKQLIDDLGAEYAGTAGNNAISLTDWILVSGTAAEPTTAIASFLGKKALTSRPFMAKVAEFLSGNKPKELKAVKTKPTVDNYINFIKKYSTESKIDVDSPIKEYTANLQPGLSIKSVPIHPEDSNSLIKFIDAVRLKGTPEAPNMSESDWLDVERILERIGFKITDKTDLNKMADEAERILIGDRDISGLINTGRPFSNEK